MKNISLILSLLFISLLSTSQPYHRFTDNYGWCVHQSFSLAETYFAYTNLGDSIVNGRVYKFIKAPYHWSDFLVREDELEQKVWIIFKDSSSENLLYDFSLKTYDSITVKPVLYPPVTYVVDSIGFAHTPLGIRKKISLSTSDTTYVYHKLIWIEGIGSTFGPDYLSETTLNPNKYFNGPFYCLICAYTSPGVQSYSQNCGLPCYPWPGGPCYSMITGMNSVPDNNPEVEVHFISSRELLFQSNEIIKLIQIFTVEGRLIDQISIADHQFTYQTNHWASGIYVIKISLDNKQTLVRKIKM